MMTAEHVPTDKEYATAIAAVAGATTSLLENHPPWRDKLLKEPIVGFGLKGHHSVESFLADEDWEMHGTNVTPGANGKDKNKGKGPKREALG